MNNIKKLTNKILLGSMVGFLFLIFVLFFYLISPEIFVEHIPTFLTDQIRFHEIAKVLSSQDWSHWALRPDSQFPAGILSAIYKVLGANEIWLMSPLLIFLAGVAYSLTVLLVREFALIEQWWLKVVCLILIFTPSSIVWWVYPHKDSFILPGILLISISMVKSLAKFSLLNLLVFSLGSFLVYVNEPSYTQLLALGIGLSLVIFYRNFQTRVLMLIILLGLTFVSVKIEKTQDDRLHPSHIALLKDWRGSGFALIDIPLKKLANRRENFLNTYSHGRSNYLSDVHLGSTSEALFFLPHAIQLSFFEPLPWRHAEGDSRIKMILWFALKIEMIFFYLSLCFIFFNFKKVLKSSLILNVCLSLPFLLALGYAVPNIGSINRYRFPFVLLLKITALKLFWDWWKIKIPVRQKKIVLFHGPDDLTFVIQRLVMAKALQNNGYEIHVACPDTGSAKKIQELGFVWHPLDSNRGGLNPIKDIKPLMSLMRLMKEVKPDFIQNISVKPVIYGSLIAGLTGVPCIVNLINGLGYAFEGKGIKGRLVKWLAMFLYKLGLSQDNVRVIFQNPDDLAQFHNQRITFESQTMLIPGSGVNRTKFHEMLFPKHESPKITFIGRLIWSKGIGDLVEAIKILKSKGLKFDCEVVGEPDLKNPDSVTIDEIKSWEQEGLIRWLGRQTDMPAIYANSDIICLPSYYREGIPLTLIEAASCGRPLVAADSPGTKEPVQDGVNGFLVKPRDPSSLAAALEKLILSKELRDKMGHASAEYAEERFSSQKIEKQFLAVYNSLRLIKN